MLLRRTNLILQQINYVYRSAKLFSYEQQGYHHYEQHLNKVKCTQRVYVVILAFWILAFAAHNSIISVIFINICSCKLGVGDLDKKKNMWTFILQYWNILFSEGLINPEG